MVHGEENNKRVDQSIMHAYAICCTHKNLVLPIARVFPYLLTLKE